MSADRADDVAEVLAAGGPLPATLDVPEAASLVGVSTWAAYNAIRRGDWPTSVLHVGRRIRVPTRPLLDVLGVRPGDEPTTRTEVTE